MSEGSKILKLARYPRLLVATKCQSGPPIGRTRPVASLDHLSSC